MNRPLTKHITMRPLPHTWLVFLLFLPGLYLSAQTGNKNDLPSLFRQYQSGVFQEKVFVHTDKTCYLAGELIWFSIYNVDEYLNKPSDISTITYVELIGSNQRPALQGAITMQHGKGNGSFLLPSSIASGMYTLRAYTAWMKNFSPDFYYRQEITVINTIKDIPASSPISLGPPTSSSGPISPLPSPAPVAPVNSSSGPSPLYDIRFFPEGGNLVYGLPSTIAFKAVDSNGAGLPCKGALLDQRNDTMAVFTASWLGMGNFAFTPREGSTYYALVTINGNTTRQSLPAPFSQGYTMHLSDIGGDRIKITVNTNITGGDPSIFLFIHTRHLGKVFLVNQVSNGVATFSVDKNSLGEGISHITVFNASKVPVAERLYFKPPVKRLSLQATLSQKEYNRREKVDLAVSAKDPSGHLLAADISISAFLLDTMQSIPQDNILNYLWLTSELKGRIESPQLYFEDHGDSTKAAIENLMLTQGWRRFRWEDVLQNKKPFFEFLPEMNGQVINGRILDKTTGLPVPAVTGYLSLPGKYFSFSTAVSQPDGTIRFHPGPGSMIGNNEIVVQTNAATDSNDRIDIAGPFSDKISEDRVPDLLLPAGWESQLRRRSIDVQVENSYLTDQKRRFMAGRVADTLPFYGIPDHRYSLDDYTRFVTLEEVIREYVLDVRVRRLSGKYYYRVRNSLFNVFFEDAPLLLVDGIPVFDADRLMAMDPLRIRQVDVVSHKFYTGPLASDGIVSLRTYEGDLGGYALDANAVAIQYNGLQQEREFYTPMYENKDRQNSPIPDRRNVLCWLPAAATDSLGQSRFSFYTSDLAGQFALVIQGLTADGLPGSTVLTFTVTPQPVSRTPSPPAAGSSARTPTHD